MTQTLDWTAVMAAVHRERFIPDVIYRHDRDRDGNDLVPVGRHTDPAAWSATVAADEPLYTQVDNGRERNTEHVAAARRWTGWSPA